MKDPIVAEVRRHRMEHSREFGNDLKAIVADLRARQAASGREYVRLTPRRKIAGGIARTKMKQAA